MEILNDEQEKAVKRLVEALGLDTDAEDWALRLDRRNSTYRVKVTRRQRYESHFQSGYDA